MRFVYSPAYEVDIGPHVFPTSKYRLVHQRLLEENLARESDFVSPQEPTREQLELVHTPGLLNDLEQLAWTYRTTDSELPLSASIVQAYRLAAGGSILASRLALTGPERICVHLGGGFHHAFADHAEGFCYLNDIAVAIRTMQREQRVKRAMVVDCDLHQGNGTAHIFSGDPSVFTISLHQENNYPPKQRSDIDLGLEDDDGDEAYLQALRGVFPAAAEKHRPELLIYVAGADPYEEDLLGALKLTLAGLRSRDEHVLGEAARLGIASVVVLAGGYAKRLEDVVTIHTQTCRVALQIGSQRQG